MALWEILVPTIRRANGKPYKTRYHRVWDEKVREITGGLTVLQPVKGYWISPNEELFSERMIPVRIMCTGTEMGKIASMTADYYDQLAVMYYKVTDAVTILHRS